MQNRVSGEVLEDSLKQAAIDPAYRPQFIRDFVAADILVLNQVKEGEKSVQIEHIEFKGKSCIPIFSSLEQLREALIRFGRIKDIPNARFLQMHTTDFLRMTKGEELLLNPGAEFSKEFTVAEIESILDGSIWKPSQILHVGKSMLIGQPKEYPTKLASALTRVFTTIPQVKRAWLAHVHYARGIFFPKSIPGEKPHTLIVIEQDGNFEQFLGEIWVIVRGIQAPDSPVDFLEFTGEGGVEDSILRNNAPFYAKP